MTINTFKIVNCSDNNRSCTIEWVSRGEQDEIIWLSFFHVIKINEHIFGGAEIFSELISSHWSVCVMKKCKPGKVKLFILTFPIGMSNLLLSWEVVFYLPKVSVLFEQKQRVTNKQSSSPEKSGVFFLHLLNFPYFLRKVIVSRYLQNFFSFEFFWTAREPKYVTYTESHSVTDIILQWCCVTCTSS